ncbi:hypothetical protein Tsubulata_050694 [Turnera subulata]|uniref:Cytochrome P450 n=1 Tax=Turnera subulata TaxID=218843 RepID=A0A9Q0GBC8_9ROSI|nr:hypothetical protein Tsubulata_050694 [Turnera subulata]
MDHLLPFPTGYLPSIFAILALLYALSWISKARKPLNKKKEAPEGGGAWPVIGHLHLLGGPQPPHMVLANMADKWGPIFTIRMGVHKALVVSNWELAKECLTTNDKAFASRPKTLATDLLGYNRSMIGFSPYGPYWRQMRKIATLELLSNHRLETLKHVRESEMRASMKELYKSLAENNSKQGNNRVLVDMKTWFGDITLNVIFKIIVGKSLGYSDRDRNEGWKDALREFFDLSGRFVPADALPFLRFLDIGGYERSMKRTAKELEHAMVGWLEEHKQKKARGEVKGQEDFMDVMISIVDREESVQGRDADTITKATCLALILAASDTTTVTLAWALSLLVNHQDVLKKVQQELDLNVGRGRQVQESELKHLIYLQAIVKETLRLYPAGPLSMPHESMEDCTVGGYHIPAGTRLLVNIWKIHRDPRVWSGPGEFLPERFLTTHKDLDFRGQDFEFIPFGGGRRMCPGISFAHQVLQLTLATLLHGFDFATAHGGPVDMIESTGLTNLRATRLDLVLNPRLLPQLYLNYQ